MICRSPEEDEQYRKSLQQSIQAFRTLSQETLRMAVDKELLTIQRVLKNLEPLTLEEQLRVVNYVFSRMQEKRSQVDNISNTVRTIEIGESHNG